MDKAALEKMDYFHFLKNLIHQREFDEDLTQIDKKTLQISPQKHLNFPVRDIDVLHEDEQSIHIVCQFMGLYGVDSPLPPYFNEMCLKQDPCGEVLRAFLDLLNHRNYILYFLAWLAFQPELQAENEFYNVIKGLSGDQVLEEGFSLASYLAHDNAMSLEALIQQLMPDVPVNIIEFCPGWESIEPIARIGDAHLALGDNTMLSDAFYDESSSIQIQIGPISKALAHKLMPEEKSGAFFVKILRKSIQKTVKFTLNLQVQIERSTHILGSHDLSLGRYAWLGQAQEGILSVDLPDALY